MHEALDQRPEDRDRWLARACADDEEVLAQARTLVRAAAFTGSFLERRASAGWFGDSGRPDTQAGQARSVDRTLGHYRLLRWLGAGGMGEVFLAQDLALGREAALKLLAPDFDPDLRIRLLREAEAASKLQHPAIATFFEAGEADGEAFIAMEFVRGQTLRERLAEGPLPVDQALSITRCLLEALVHAHAAGILHRDIKPENVIVNGPRSAKLLDFGIARALAVASDGAGPLTDATPLALTATRLAGTIGSMAPEQVRCEPLDARTDVFQVGIVLYEMLTGLPAFPGGSPLERLAAVMLLESEFVAATLPALSAPLLVVLQRALAFDRGSRYATAAAFLADLQDLVEGPAMTGLPSTIAALDLENLGGDQEMDWLGTAVADSLRARLSRMAGPTIVTGDKVSVVLQSVKERDASVRALEVGRRIGCGNVVSGSFQSDGRSLTVTMSVVDVPTGRTKILNPVDGSIDDIFALEDRLAGAVATSLGLTLSQPDSTPPKSVEAYECFARARLLLDRLGKGTVDQARDFLDRAIAIDPGYVAALAAMANAYGFRSIATTDPRDLDRALHFAGRAIELDPRNSEAYTWRGYALMRQTRFADAAAAYRRASELDPAHAMSQYFAGCNALFIGRSAEALPFLQRAVNLDARAGMLWLGLGAAHLCLQQPAEARYSFGRARDLEGESGRFATAGAEAYVAEVFRLEGQLDEARAHALKGLESVERSDHAYRDTFRAHALVVLGRTALDQGDLEAARAAFGQVRAQAHGRPRTRSCGHLVVRALAGLAVANADPRLLEEACRLYDARETYNFEPFYGALEHESLSELGRSALALDRPGQARELFARARDAGSLQSSPATSP